MAGFVAEKDNSFNAGGVGGFFDDIANNPLIALGAGLLSAPGASFGQALGQGLQFAGQAKQQQQQNQLLRARLANEAREQAAAERQQASVQRLQSLFEPDPGAPVPITPEGIAEQKQRQMLGLLAEVAPDQFAQALLKQTFPEQQDPTTFQRDFQFMTAPKEMGGLGLDAGTALDRLRKGVTVNVGDAENPLSVSDIANVRLPDGSPVPLGTTASQARAMGAVVVTQADRDKAAVADNALSILGQIEEVAIGPDGVLVDVQPGLLNRGVSALSQTLELLTQNDPAVEQLQSLSLGTGAGIVRAMGEKGALSDGDVQRALGLLPQVGNLGQLRLPDTRESATEKLRQLREILERGAKRLNTGEVVTPRQPKPEAAPTETPRLKFNPATGQLE